MKTCLTVPRILLPRGDFEQWAVPSGRLSPSCRQRVERNVGYAPSAFRFFVPQTPEEEDEGPLFEAIREAMFEAFESGAIEKLNRGFLLVKRQTSFGLRRGIMAAVDLEAYTMFEGDTSAVRPVTAPDRETMLRLVRMRERFPMEFPSTVIAYRDKHSKIMKNLGDDLEEVYHFDLMEDGGEISAYFIPMDAAMEVAEDMHTRGEVSFAVLEGIEEISAAKLHWENVKRRECLTEEEQAYHPARFFLAEFVNIYEEGVVLLPKKRVVSDVEPEAFRDFFTRRVKCKKGLAPAYRDEAEGAARADAAIAEFLKKNGGQVTKTAFPEDGDGIVVDLSAPDKEDIFALLKKGKLLPDLVTLGGENDRRYILEGRETSYD